MSAAAEGRPAAAAAAGEMVREATAWCALHGLVVGDRADPVTPLLLLIWFHKSQAPPSRLHGEVGICSWIG